MFFFFQILAFLIFSFLFFYIPGKLLIEKLGINLQFLESITVNILLGIFIFVFISLLIRGVGFPSISAVLILIIFDVLYFLRGKISTHKKFLTDLDFKRIDLVFLLIVTLGIFTQNLIHFKSETVSNDGISFLAPPFHDAAFHLSFIGELKNHFPPQNPFFAGFPLKNYHYLSDFLIAQINSALPIPLLDLYFKILPIFVSLYFGMAIYALSSKFTKKKWVKNLALFLTFFGGPFSYLIPLFRKGPWDAFTFMLNQPFDFSFNIQSLFSIAILLVGFLLVCEYFESKRENFIYLAAVVFSFSFGFKSYVSILGLGALFATSLYVYLTRKKIIFIKALLLAVIIFSISFVLLMGNLGNGLKFLPGWLLKRMVEDPDRLYLPRLTLLEQYYRSTNNFLRIFQINIEEFSLYFFGNLGIRLIGFIYLLLLFKKPFKIPLFAFVAMMIVSASLLIPIFFNQGSSSYDILQFGVYSLPILSIFSAVALEKLSIKINLFQNHTLLGVLLFLIIILAVPSNIKTFYDRLKYQQLLIPKGEIAVLKFLRDKSPKSSVILLYPSYKNNTYAYIPAFSQRKVFFTEDSKFEMTNIPYNKRKRDTIDFFQSFTPDKQNEFIKENNISYIYLTKEDQASQKQISKTLPFKQVVKSDSAVLLKTSSN